MIHFSQLPPQALRDSQVQHLADYMNDLAKREAEALGFIPNSVYPQAILRNQVKFSEENGQLCGFMLHGPPRNEVRVYQTAIEFDLRRLDHGTCCVHRLIREALEEDQEKIILHCAIDLQANRFWRAAGFVLRGTRHAAHATRRELNRWELILPRGEDLERFLTVELKKTKAEKILELFGQKERFLKHRTKMHRTGLRPRRPEDTGRPE